MTLLLGTVWLESDGNLIFNLSIIANIIVRLDRKCSKICNSTIVYFDRPIIDGAISGGILPVLWWVKDDFTSKMQLKYIYIFSTITILSRYIVF